MCGWWEEVNLGGIDCNVFYVDVVFGFDGWFYVLDVLRDEV
jgi:hypothetical protein